MKYFSADIIYDGRGNRYEDHVLILDGHEVVGIVSDQTVDSIQVEHYEGILFPGLVNSHCHLELSHMKNKVPTGTGLLPFIEHVVKHRGVAEQEIMTAIKDADQEMVNNGIVAVGDISNKADTAATKDTSQISYYTFVEMFDFLQPSKTKETIDQYKAVLDQQSDRGYNKKNFVPHAPYTVSPDLFSYLASNTPSSSTVSIHNQETAHEDELFVTGKGGFVDWYRGWGFEVDPNRSIGKTSIHYAMQHMNPSNRTLFVHNTMTTQADIAAAHRWSEKVYWATCPRANLYIENRLPVYKHFTEENARLTIGTDSLTSNWSLDIWAEILTILQYASYLTLDEVLVWATYNGAKALGYQDRLGSFEPGKSPGVNLVACDVVKGQPILNNTKVQPLL